MKILNLTLENFRAIKSLTIDFGGKDTDIYGANGLGKTTIANAICWLLIDRPATEEAGFDPKTTGAHGLHHRAD
ncbi:MAG: AAA family ATPase, partial [Selenomonadaceae bacterium]|nr:AAA family ATPase [Selenomonadaceae bacterium]